jgi:hypothetical protein
MPTSAPTAHTLHWTRTTPWSERAAGTHYPTSETSR